MPWSHNGDIYDGDHRIACSSPGTLGGGVRPGERGLVTNPDSNKVYT